MRTRTSTQSRLWRPALRCLLALYLACSVGGDRLLGLAHLAFSDHRHVFCEEHGRFQDLPKTSPSVRETSWNPVIPEQDLTAVSASPASFAVHTDCAFLNGRSFQGPLQFAEQGPAATPEHHRLDRECPRQDGVAGCSLLLSAPKTSPPVVAA